MEDDKRPPLEEDICIHIFTVSSGMVGVCLTAVGLLHVVTSIRKVATFADDINGRCCLVSRIGSKRLLGLAHTPPPDICPGTLR